MLVNGYIFFILRNIPYCVIYIYMYRYVRFTSYTYVQICRCDLTGQICSTSRKGWGLDGVQPGRIGDSKVHLLWDRLNSGQACQRGSGRRAQHLLGPAGMCFFFWRLQYQNHKVLVGFVDVSFSKSNSLCKPLAPGSFQSTFYSSCECLLRWIFYPFTFDWVHIFTPVRICPSWPLQQCPALSKLRCWERSFEQKPRMLHPRSVSIIWTQNRAVFFLSYNFWMSQMSW